MKELIPHLGELLSVVLASIAILGFSKIKAWLKVREKGMDTGQVDYNNRIHDILVETRALFDADRAKLFQFKNGSHYASGSSEQKLSLTHVVCAPGIANPIGLETYLMDVRVSFLTSFLSEIVEKGHVIVDIDDIDSKFENHSDIVFIRQLFTQSGTKCFLASGIRAGKNKLLGIVFVTWRQCRRIHSPAPILAKCEELSANLLN